MKKYPKIEGLGHEHNRDIFLYSEDEIVIEEKVDGGNGSFWVDDDGLIHVSTRNRDLTAEKDEKTLIKQRQSLMNILKDKKINPNYFYYIEWMQRHTINYTRAPDVIGFDIRLKYSMNSDECGLFLGRDAKEREFSNLAIPVVALAWRGKAYELRNKKLEEIIGKSNYYDGTMEGIVIKNYSRKAPVGNHQIMAKIVREEFKEDNQAVFGKIKQKSSDTLKIVDQYCTDARIRKIVLQFVNENNEPLDLKLMKIVPSAVIKDIIAEEFSGIFENYSFIDFKEMKQCVAKNCLRVIREMMVETVK